MFSDKFQLTKAVLEGRKTMTRRIIPEKVKNEAYEYMQKCHGTGHDIKDYLLAHAPYKVGDILAVAQAYRYLKYKIGTEEGATPGWSNKMFVKAELMPHRICITNINIERLQDISDKDCQREGITTMTEGRYEAGNGYGWNTTIDALKRETFFTPRAAFAALINKVSGKGTWERNPWVFVYEFELVK